MKGEETGSVISVELVVDHRGEEVEDRQIHLRRTSLTINSFSMKFRGCAYSTSLSLLSRALYPWPQVGVVSTVDGTVTALELASQGTTRDKIGPEET